MQTRRDFLKRAIALSGAAGFSGIVPGSIQRAFAIDPALGSTYMDAEHIVILMQENRSFDHALGTLQGVRGFNDPRAIRQPNENLVWLQSNAAGETYCPFRLNMKDSKATWMGDLPHNRDSQLDAWNGGKYNQWLSAKQSRRQELAHVPFTMGHYSRADIPFYYALADAFTVCDQNFSSVLSSTTPNRMLFWTGTVREQQNSKSKAYLRNSEYTNGGAHWKTFPEHLQENGVSWKLYQNEISIITLDGLSHDQDAWLSNFGSNPFEQFAQYNVQLSKYYLASLPVQIAKLSGEIATLEKSLAEPSANPRTTTRMQSQLKEKRATLAICKQDMANNHGAFEKLPKMAQDLHNAAFVINAGDPDYHELEQISYMDGDTQRDLVVPKGDVLHQFRRDVESGTLPTVSWLTAPETFSDHPDQPWFGAWYVSEVMDILTKNPEVWKKTIFILNYDENDGYFDHIPPYVAPDPRDRKTGLVSNGLENDVEYTYAEDEVAQNVTHAEARTGPIGLGFRVPMLIASPWSKGGWVNSQLFDHTSVNQFLEHFLNAKYKCNIREGNMSPWRREITGDLTSVFRPFNATGSSALPFIQRDPFVKDIHRAKFMKLPSDYRILSPVEIAQINTAPHDSDVLPRQEPGIRPSCALPYELYVESALAPDGSAIRMNFHAGNAVFGANSSGAPFNVYARGLKTTESPSVPIAYASYTVAAGATLTESWPLDAFADGDYHLAAHGPNGFFREFTGSRKDPSLRIDCEYEFRPGDPKKLTGRIVLRCINSQSSSCTIQIVDHAYGAKPVTRTLSARSKADIVLPLQSSFGWYDFSVYVKEAEGFGKRYAGRVETGAASYSDPFMGRTVKLDRV